MDPKKKSPGADGNRDLTIVSGKRAGSNIPEKQLEKKVKILLSMNLKGIEV